MAHLEPLRHLVERPRQLADLAGAFLGQPEREFAAGDPAGAARDRAHRAADRACEHDPEEDDQGHRRADGDRADEHGDVGALVRVAGRLGGELVLRAPEVREEPPDLVGLQLADSDRGGVVLDQIRYLLHDPDDRRERGERVLADLRLDLPCLLSLARVVLDESRRDCDLAVQLPACLAVRTE